MLLLTLGLISCVVLLLYIYLTWEFNYWKIRGVPGPTPKPLIGTVPNAIFQKRNFYYDFQDIYNKYKGNPFAGMFFMRTPQILAIDPEFVKEVMVKNFKNFHDNDYAGFIDPEIDPIFSRNPLVLAGEEWKEKRSEITPAFTPARIKALYPLIEDICLKMTNYLKKESDKKPVEGIDCKELSAKFTTDVVASCIFAAEGNSFSENDAIIRTMGKNLMAPNFKLYFYFALRYMFPIITNNWKMPIVNKKIEKFFIQTIEEAISSREKSKTERMDYLHFLIHLKDRKKLENVDLAAHGITFFVDGFETSSIVMAHTSYELGKNKRVQEKLRNEIKEHIITHGKLDYDVVNEMPYLDQVFYEALRMHPPLFNLSRKCTESIELNGPKDKKILIEKGMAINVPIYSIQRDPEYYENPEEFFPERFDPENGGVKAFRDKGVLMPFGDGPRICLGMRFALAQAKAGLIEIVRNFEISVNAKTQEPFVLDPKEFMTMPIGGIWLDFKII